MVYFVYYVMKDEDNQTVVDCCMVTVMVQSTEFRMIFLFICTLHLT